MWAYYLLFFFAAVGAKLIMAMVTVYLLFSTERSCNACDGETLPLRMGAPARALSRLLGGRLQRRWCPRCGWEGSTRTSGHAAEQAKPAPRHSPLPRR